MKIMNLLQCYLWKRIQIAKLVKMKVDSASARSFTSWRLTLSNLFLILYVWLDSVEISSYAQKLLTTAKFSCALAGLVMP